MSDIIDRIDELVDEQMSAGEVRSDYLNNDPTYPRCPHCNRHWHGLRITQRIADMYSWGRYDDTYSAAEDDTDILCEGSEFIGPQRPQGRATSWGGDWDTVSRREISFSFDFSEVNRQLSEMIRGFDALRASAQAIFPRYTLYTSDWVQLGYLDESLGPAWTYHEPDPCPDGLVVEFGPQNWIHELNSIPQSRQFPRNPMYRTPLEREVINHWSGFTAPDYPVPTSPGLDVEYLKTQVKPFGNTGPELPPLRQRAVS